jgi:hypothetical protein
MGYKNSWRPRTLCGQRSEYGTPKLEIRDNSERLQERLMDVAKILADLRQEREQLEEAILSLERLAMGRGRRRGRPPAWMSEAKRRGRPPGSKNKTHSVPKSQPQAKTVTAAA